MIVACPECHARFRVDETSVKSPFQKMRCSKCGHVFSYAKEDVSLRQAPKAGPTVEESSLTEDFVAEAQRQTGAAARKRHTGLKVTFICLAVLAAIVAGLYFYWMNYLGASDKWLKIGKLEGQEVLTPETKVFLITGSLYNGSTKPRKYVRLKAKLFDRAGNVITEKESLAGLVLLKDEVSKMPRADLEKKVADFKAANVSSLAVDSHREIPFSVLFFEDSFSSAKEFSVEVIEAVM